MKFTISREALLKPLQVVSGVVEKRQTLPVLSNILVEATENRLKLTGTDLEVELLAGVEIEGAAPGEVTLPARKFMDICRTLPEGAQLQVTVEDGKAVLRSGKSRFTLATLPATEFPATESVAATFDMEVGQEELKKLLDQTQFCMANQDVRYYLNGLLLEIEHGKLRTVATDGHRLAMSELEHSVETGQKHQVIVPRKGVVELSRLLGDGEEKARVELNANHIRIRLGDVTMTSKLIDGKFPDYDRVIPQDTPRTVVADRETLRQALARASILSNEKYRGVRVQLDENRLRALVHNPEQEEAEEEVPVEYASEPLEIGFNVAYVLDALGAVREEQVWLGLTDSNSSALVRGLEDKSSQYVIMPMRL